MDIGGGTGDQTYVGKILPIDVQGSSLSGWLENVRVNVLLNDSELSDTGGYIAYLSTNSTWDDASVITARAGNFASDLSLTCKRPIKDAGFDASRNDAAVALWLEVTDITLTADVSTRVVVEAWGRFIDYSFV